MNANKKMVKELVMADNGPMNKCEGHPAGEFDPMGKTVYCDGSCRPLKKVWIVTKPSAYRRDHTCVLGRGATRAAAIESAYGPKSDWSSQTKAQIRSADVYEISEDDADELESNL